MMAEINHRVGIKAAPSAVYEALTTNAGLASWWTEDVSGAGEVGSVIEFRFGGGGPDFKVIELIPNELVRWRHFGEMPADWMETEIQFQLQLEDEQTFVRFTHSNWQEASDFLSHCSTKWGVFMLSLKDVLEHGTGSPFPNDVQIDHSE